jgi:hypothetical protein
VCIKHKSNQTCGEVVDAKPNSAVVKLDNMAFDLAPGDPAELSAGAPKPITRKGASEEPAHSTASVRRFSRGIEGQGDYSRFGILAGSNLANAEQDPAPTSAYSMRLGGYGGFTYVTRAFHWFYWGPEFVYVENGPSLGNAGKLKLDYFELPILVKLKVPTSPVAPFLIGGVGFGLLINAQIQVGTGKTATNISIKDQVRGFDVDAQGGLGLEVDLGEKMTAFLSARYHHGMINLVKADGAGTYYNTGIIVVGGLLFDLDFFDNVDF